MMVQFKKRKGAALLIEAVLAAIVGMMVAYGLVATSSGQFAALDAARTAQQTQQLAQAKVNEINVTPYASIPGVAAARAAVAGTNFEREVVVGPEVDLGGGNKQRTVTVNVYKPGEADPRYALESYPTSAGTGNFVLKTGDTMTGTLIESVNGLGHRLQQVTAGVVNNLYLDFADSNGSEAGWLGYSGSHDLTLRNNLNGNTNIVAPGGNIDLQTGGTASVNGQQIVTNGSWPSLSGVYNSGWYYNTNAYAGLYNSATNSHWFSESASFWQLRSGNGMHIADASGANKGYLYFDGSGFGLLNSNGGWAVRTDPSMTQLYSSLATRLTTNYGYVDIGAENSSCTHYVTDRPYHYFNRPLLVQGDLYGGNSYNRRLAYADEIAAIKVNSAVHADTADYATNAGNADTLDGYHASSFMIDAGHDFESKGYQIMSNGMILQWGGLPNLAAYLGTYNGKVDFPIPFPHACISAIVCKRTYTSNWATLEWNPNTTTNTQLGFTMQYIDEVAGIPGLSYIAIGY